MNSDVIVPRLDWAYAFGTVKVDGASRREVELLWQLTRATMLVREYGPAASAARIIVGEDGGE